MKTFTFFVLFLSCLLAIGFTPPEIGETVTVYPRIGPPVTGTLEELERAAVVVDGQRFEARELSRESWALLFEDYHRTQQVQQRRSAIEAQADYFSDNIKVGDVGRFRYSARVLQVLGDEDMIVETTARISQKRTRIATPVGMPRGGEHVQLSTERIAGPTVRIKGYPTRNIADGQDVKPDGTFVVTGTAAHETVLGARRTLLVLEPVN
jgi:hypothetical protein